MKQFSISEEVAAEEATAVEDTQATQAGAPPAERVVLVEPHQVCRRLVADLISRTKRHLSVVGETHSSEEAAPLASKTNASIVLLFADSSDAVRSILAIRDVAPRARIVVLSERIDGETVFDAVRAGAIGFLSETAEPEDVVEALDRAARGETSIDSSLMTAGIMWAAREADESSDIVPLTKRERDVLDLMVEGLSSGSIAEKLFLSRRTVESHLSSAYHKLRVRGRIEAFSAYQIYRKRRPQSVHRDAS